jgi:type II secretory pathway component GspD/PulD (secretin)
MPVTVVTPAGVQPEASPPQASSTTSAAPAAAPSKSSAQPTAPAPQPPPRSATYLRAVELGRPRAPESRWHGFPISLSLRDAPLPEVLRSFAHLAGINLVLDPKVHGTVTVELHDVPWDQALYVILKTHGLAAEIDGRVWIVEP